MRLVRLTLGLAVVVTALAGGRMVQRALAVEAPPLLLVPATPTHQVSLRDRLIVGLEARLKSELAFVDAVVLEVRAGHIPERIVNQTFFWARQRSTEIHYGWPPQRPIIYFQPAMRARAKKLQVSL